MKKLKTIIPLFVLALAMLVLSPLATKAQETAVVTSAEIMPITTSVDSGRACTLEYMPVCGKDGKNYANKCLAQRVGVDYEGKCEVLEKISSPNQIKYFKLIKNENGHLYGIRTADLIATDISSDKSLEKISHPNQIKYFQVMKKDGHSLYGQRLEKIAHPQFIHLYRNIKAMDKSLWGIKK